MATGSPTVPNSFRQLSVAALLLGTLALAACAAAGAGPAPAAPGEERHLEGRGLYEQRCGRCHELFDPGEFDADEWRRYVKRYGARAGLKPAERETVTVYLVEACTRR